MSQCTKLAASQAALNTLADAIDVVHTDGGVAVLTDELAHFSEVQSALEPVLSALFALTAAGEAVDLDEVSGDLGLLAAERGEFNPAERARPYLERAVEDGEAFREITTKALLLSDIAVRAAKGRAEWCKWEAQVDDDVSPGAVNMDVDSTARHHARQFLRRDPLTVPAEPALYAVQGFRAAGLPLNRSVWRYALDGARAGFVDHQEETEAEERRKAYFANRVAAAFAGEGQ
jgi:hypothetical protein